MTAEIRTDVFPVRKMALENEDFRRVLRTGEKTQVVLMCIPEGKSIGLETHDGHDQVLVFVQGEGLAKIGGTESLVTDGDLAFVGAGEEHDFVNTGEGPLKLYTTYSPPEHAPGERDVTKDEAEEG
ncbi:MAG TPA: cupin domain-containing protein [Paracoccaceae bacterium]|nr:cupin domain-containing protein [Paracoccaceae bacterium]